MNDFELLKLMFKDREIEYREAKTKNAWSIKIFGGQGDTVFTFDSNDGSLMSVEAFEI